MTSSRDTSDIGGGGGVKDVVFSEFKTVQANRVATVDIVGRYGRPYQC